MTRHTEKAAGMCDNDDDDDDDDELVRTNSPLRASGEPRANPASPRACPQLRLRSPSHHLRDASSLRRRRVVLDGRGGRRRATTPSAVARRGSR